jgi:hypothetical protein
MWNLGNKVFLENGHGRLTRRSIFALSIAELRQFFTVSLRCMGGAECHTELAIKKLDLESMQEQTEFLQEVQVQNSAGRLSARKPDAVAWICGRLGRSLPRDVADEGGQPRQCQWSRTAVTVTVWQKTRNV